MGVLLTAARDRRCRRRRHLVGAPLAAGRGRTRRARRCWCCSTCCCRRSSSSTSPAAEIDLDHGVGLGLALVALRSPASAHLVGREPGAEALRATRPAPCLRRAQRQHGLPRLPADGGAARAATSSRPRSSTTSSSPAPRCCSAPSRSAPPSGPRRANARASGCGPSSPATRRSTRRSPACSRRARWRRDVLVDASQALIVAILPIGFFAVGATLAEGAEHGELPLPPPLTKPVLLALVGAPGRSSRRC